MTNETQTESLGQRIRRLRKGKGLSYDKFAQLAGVSKNTILSIESGVTKGLQSETLRRYAEALNVTTQYLLTGVETPNDLPDNIEVWLRSRGELQNEEKRRIVANAYQMLLELERLEREKDRGDSESSA